MRDSSHFLSILPTQETLMNTPADYPGTPQQQALLQAIVSYYADDPRILAVAVFGSFGRGTWDRYSDLDLDVVIANGVEIDAIQELRRLCDSLTSIGERVALIVPDGDDAGDVVLESLMEFSIRYHPLQTTSPNIVDSVQILTGRIDGAAIKAAGLANRRSRDRPPSRLLDMCVRYAVGVDVALQRSQIWGAIELLHRMRGLFMELFARTRNGMRPRHVFQAEADAALQARLGATLPQYDLTSAQESLAQILQILECDLGQLTDGQTQLTDAHRKVLNLVRLRQARLNLNDGNTKGNSGR